MSEQAKEASGVQAQPHTSDRLWTRAYLLVCSAAFLAYTNYALLTPTIPLFISDLGGSNTTVGTALAAFSTVSFLVRPFIGRLVDTWSARGIFGLGSLLVGLGGLSYLLPSLALVFVGRAVQGLGWAGVNTGATTMVANLAPPHRRGEASGYFGTALMIATGFLPSVALWLVDAFNFAVIFLLAGLAPLIGAALTLGIRGGTRPGPAVRSRGLLASLVEPGAFLPSGLLLLLNLSFPAAVFFLPLYARELAITVDTVALIFLVQGSTTVLIQAGLGRLSDRIGRSPAIACGVLITMGGLLLLSQARGLPTLAAGGALYACGFSIVSPALMALVMDRAQPARFGAAMATYSLSFQVGNAGGALVGGLLIDWSGYRVLYLASVLPLLLALAIVARNWQAGAQPAKAALPASRLGGSSSGTGG